MSNEGLLLTPAEITHAIQGADYSSVIRDGVPLPHISEAVDLIKGKAVCKTQLAYLANKGDEELVGVIKKFLSEHTPSIDCNCSIHSKQREENARQLLSLILPILLARNEKEKAELLEKEHQQGYDDGTYDGIQRQLREVTKLKREIAEAVAKAKKDARGALFKEIKSSSHTLQGDNSGLDGYDVSVGDRVIAKEAWQALQEQGEQEA